MPLGKKSIENIKSAKFLIKEECFSSSIHCSYYSCLQQVLYIIFNKIEGGKKEFNDMDGGWGSHVKAINIIKKHFKPEAGRDRKSFSKIIGNLKRSRVKADYKLAIFNKADSEKCLETANSLLSLLNKNF